MVIDAPAMDAARGCELALGFLGRPLSGSFSTFDELTQELLDGVSRLFGAERSGLRRTAPCCPDCSQPMYLLLAIEASLSHLLSSESVPRQSASESGWSRSLLVYWCPPSPACTTLPPDHSDRFQVHRCLVRPLPAESAEEELEEVPLSGAASTQPLGFGAWGSQAPFGDADDDCDLEALLEQRNADLATRSTSPLADQVRPPLAPKPDAGSVSDLSVDFEMETQFLPKPSRSQVAMSSSSSSRNGGGGAPEDVASWTDETYESTTVADKFVYRFSKRIGWAPEQVVRWQWAGQPLLLGPLPSSANPAPTCSVCGAPRHFELQILPTLAYLCRSALAALHVTSGDPAARNLPDLLPQLELGTLLCFTCARDCLPRVDGNQHSVVLPEWSVLCFESKT